MKVTSSEPKFMIAGVRQYVHGTQMQMLQFLLMNAQAIYIITQGCANPNDLTKFYLGYIISLFGLFLNFYLKRWATGGKAKTA